MKDSSDRVARDWARLGVLFNCTPAPRTPDLERLLLETARRCGSNSRLFTLAVTWAARYGELIARHRLARLVDAELAPRWRPVLALILEEAVANGATRDLLIAARHCVPAVPPRPLAEPYAVTPDLRRIAELNASTRSRKWGVWAPEVELKGEAIRPWPWILNRNPSLRDRAVRKGDLRVSIIETLRRDVPGSRVRSQSELARLCGATRLAVYRALGALIRENEVAVEKRSASDRNSEVILKSAA